MRNALRQIEINLFQILFFSFGLIFISAQELKPGFDPNEYAELLRVGARQKGPIHDSIFPYAHRFKLTYQSPSMGMDNAWQLWSSTSTNELNQAVIALRATTDEMDSWFENLYSVMISASGKLQLEKDFLFTYKLAENPRASVHIGWLIGMAYLQRDILSKIDSCYQTGTKNFYLYGHSQGGAISYLMTAFLHYEQLEGRLPKDIRFKTYSSASPKPGNLYFAYDYESYTEKGWSYNVTNTEDWVPQVPFSMQTQEDFVLSNPFKHYKDMTQEIPWIERSVVRGKFRSIMRSLDKSRKKYSKIIGKQFSSLMKNYLEDMDTNLDFTSTDYQRCGNQISLLPDDNYYKYVQKNHPNFYRNHGIDAYQLLLETHYMDEMKPEYIIYSNYSYPFYDQFPPKPKGKIIQKKRKP